VTWNTTRQAANHHATRELRNLSAESDRLRCLLGEDPDAPRDLTAIIANGQAALAQVLAPERHAEHLRFLRGVSNPRSKASANIPGDP
jgi:hypothetical protein